MHETAIASGIIKEAKKHGSVKEIYLEVGELASVPSNEILECLKRIVPWKIHLKEKPAKVECPCGFEGHPEIIDRGHDYFFIECPRCKNIPDISDGKDIKILKVVVD